MALAAVENASQTRGGPVVEARTGKRFPLELPIRISRGGSGDYKGTTGNLSAAGVYVHADESFEVGSPVDFEIVLPTEATGGKEEVVLQCSGRVVRTDELKGGKPGETRGVACVIDSYDLVRHT
jgi:hypothetical protein